MIVELPDEALRAYRAAKRKYFTGLREDLPPGAMAILRDVVSRQEEELAKAVDNAARRAKYKENCGSWQ